MIKGIQKLTLLDYPNTLAATVFLGGCNFRCPFCHNARLVTDAASPDIPQGELFELLNKRRGILKGVCVTGGEPLLSPGLSKLLGDIKALGYLVKLDTNGSIPERLGELISDGLVDYIAMDIKNSPEKYDITAGVPVDMNAIRESVNVIMGSGLEYEFRTTVVRELHDAEDILKISEWLSGAKRYYLQAFVDSGELISSGFSAYDRETMLAFCDISRKNIKSTEIRGI